MFIGQKRIVKLKYRDITNRVNNDCEHIRHDYYDSEIVEVLETRTDADSYEQQLLCSNPLCLEEARNEVANQEIPCHYCGGLFHLDELKIFIPIHQDDDIRVPIPVCFHCWDNSRKFLEDYNNDVGPENTVAMW